MKAHAFREKNIGTNSGNNACDPSQGGWEESAYSPINSEQRVEEEAAQSPLGSRQTSHSFEWHMVGGPSGD
ncbi:hypothetical protein ANO14919_084480 [Xylariales sp. No.14919]|nr:hypothetical protein ANO14919_084480 [Xylariales sp. No.14919]